MSQNTKGTFIGKDPDFEGEMHGDDLVLADDLTVGDDASFGGDINVTGKLYLGGEMTFPINATSTLNIASGNSEYEFSISGTTISLNTYGGTTTLQTLELGALS